MVMMGLSIVFGDGYGMAEKYLLVVPITNLAARNEGACHNPGCDGVRQNNPGEPALERFAHAPNTRHEKTDGRNVCVTVCHRLKADLYQTDNRNECSQEPEPSYREIPA